MLPLVYLSKLQDQPTTAAMLMIHMSLYFVRKRANFLLPYLLKRIQLVGEGLLAMFCELSWLRPRKKGELGRR